MRIFYFKKTLLNHIWNFYSMAEQCYCFLSTETTSRILIGDKACDVIDQILKAVLKAVGLRRFPTCMALKPANSKLNLT